MIRAIAARLRPADPDEREAGFTIAEVLVAMMIFAVISVGVAAAIVNSLVLTNDSKARTVATHLANQAMDLERGKSDIFQVVSRTTSKTVGNIEYTTAVTATWADASGAIGNCGLSGSTTTIANKSVDVQVSWSSISGAAQYAPVRMTALVAPGSDSSNPESGVIFVGVVGATGTGSSGVTVTIVANPTDPDGARTPTTQPAITTTQGCSVARGVTPGNYVVKITRAGGISSTQEAAPTSSVTVTGGGTATASFQYDTAATYTPTLQTSGAATPTNLTMTYRNPTSDTVVANSGAQRLFPFTDGYNVMTGSYVGTPVATACTDVDWTAWTAPAADGKVSPSAANVAPLPGQPGPVDVPMGTFTAKTSVGAVAITATPTTVLDPADPGCGTTPATAYTFARNASNTQTLALPYGTYTITATIINAAGLSVTTPVTLAGKSKATVNGSKIMLDPRSS